MSLQWSGVNLRIIISSTYVVAGCGQHGNGGGLAGAVGTQQAEDLAFPDVKADAVDGGQVAIFFVQVVNF